MMQMAAPQRPLKGATSSSNSRNRSPKARPRRAAHRLPPPLPPSQSPTLLAPLGPWTRYPRSARSRSGLPGRRRLLQQQPLQPRGPRRRPTRACLHCPLAFPWWHSREEYRASLVCYPRAWLLRRWRLRACRRPCRCSCPCRTRRTARWTPPWRSAWATPRRRQGPSSPGRPHRPCTPSSSNPSGSSSSYRRPTTNTNSCTSITTTSSHSSSSRSQWQERPLRLLRRRRSRRAQHRRHRPLLPNPICRRRRLHRGPRRHTLLSRNRSRPSSSSSSTSTRTHPRPCRRSSRLPSQASCRRACCPTEWWCPHRLHPPCSSRSTCSSRSSSCSPGKCTSCRGPRGRAGSRCTRLRSRPCMVSLPLQYASPQGHLCVQHVVDLHVCVPHNTRVPGWPAHCSADSRHIWYVLLHVATDAC